MTRADWPTTRLLDLLEIDLPIIQAPMAGAQGPKLAAAVSAEGGLGSLPCAMISPDDALAHARQVRGATNRGFAMNFFCHRAPQVDGEMEARWRDRLVGYYDEIGAEFPREPGVARAPFNEAFCDMVEAIGPAVVSFHFGLPDDALFQRVRQTGAKILSSATTVREAKFLAEKGVDAVIAQGVEAGGHRGMFLSDDIAGQVGTLVLVPQIVDAVDVPVIAAGGIADGRGIAAAFMLGASGVQIGTAYLATPEARISDLHKDALRASRDEDSVLTNVFTGRPARGLKNRLVEEVGPISPDAPAFPLAAGSVAPLRAKAEKAGSADFSPLWSGQAGPLARAMPAGELTAALADEALARLRAFAG